MSGKTAIALLIALTFVGHSAAQQDRKKNDGQDTPVRLKTDLIEVRAVVTDRNGKPVADLKKEDFELQENGKPQSLDFFSVEQIRGDVSDKPSPVGEKATDARPSDAFSRSIILFVDTVHTSPAGIAQLKQSLRKFVDEQMTDRDHVALVNSAGGRGLMWQFTADRRALRYAIERLVPWPGVGAKDSFFTPYLAAEIERDNEEAVTVGAQIVKVEDGYKVMALGGMEPDGPAKQYARVRAKEVLIEVEHKRRISLASLKAASELLSEMPGQRLMFYLSEGFSMREVSGGLDTGEVRSAISRAVRSGVIIYSIDVGGLRTNPLFSAASGDIGARASVMSSLTRYISSSTLEMQDGMNALAKDTGGEAFFNSNNLNLALGKALDENRVYYSLAYYPSDEQSKGFRRITLKVKNRPEYNVRAQKGYMPVNPAASATAATPKEKFAQAMLSSAPQTSLRVTATAGFLASESDDAQVTWQVHLDGKGLEYRDEGGRYQMGFEVATAIYDLSGKLVRNFAETIKATLTPQRMELGRNNGYDYAKRVPLAPGLYQFRAGVLEPSTSRIGTATAWVEVPDLSRRKMALSDIFLRDDLNKTDTAAGNGNGIYTTSGIKSYKQKDALVYQLIVYNAPSPEELSMQMEIFSNGQKAYQMAWQPIAPYIVKKGEKIISLGGQFKANLPPGVYELSITIRGGVSKQASQRSVPFAVE